MNYDGNLKILGPVDMAFFYVDSDETPMNIGAVTIFDGRIDFDQFVRLVNSRLHRAPIYKQKIVQAPLNLGPPTWAFDPDFYVENHIYKIAIDPPGDEEQLRQLAGHLVSGKLDRSKPLWEIYVVDGYAREQTPIIFKIHHCMVDGLAAIEIFSLMLDLTPEPSPIQPGPAYEPPELPDTADMLLDTVRRDLPYKWNMVQKLRHDVSFIRSILSEKESRRKTLVGVANLINDNLRPIRKLPINGPNTGHMTLAWADFSLAEVRSIKANQDASVNDVMLSLLTAAVESYVVEQGADIEDQNFLRILVPVSMRLEQEKSDFGNRISVLPIDVPFGVRDPLARLAAAAAYTRVMKESSLSTGLDIVLTIPSLGLPVTQPLVWGAAPVAFAFLAHTWCTNVAGPQIPVYMLGHKLLHSYGYFPLNPSNGLACVIMSYNQRITMMLVADEGIIPDVTRLRDLLKEAYVELRTAANVQPIDPIVLTPPDDADEDEDSDAPAAVVALPKPVVAAVNTAAPAQTTNTPAQPQPAAKPAPTVIAQKHRLFSQDWAQAFCDALNNSNAYYRASTKWEAGSMAFIMKASAKDGFPETQAVLLDLHKGKCRSGRALPPAEAHKQATFVLEGSYRTWMRLLSGEVQPLPMIIRGKLNLKKGALTSLMPYTQSAQELIRCAQQIS